MHGSLTGRHIATLTIIVIGNKLVSHSPRYGSEHFARNAPFFEPFQRPFLCFPKTGYNLITPPGKTYENQLSFSDSQRYLCVGGGADDACRRRSGALGEGP